MCGTAASPLSAHYFNMATHCIACNRKRKRNPHLEHIQILLKLVEKNKMTWIIYNAGNLLEAATDPSRA